MIEELTRENVDLRENAASAAVPAANVVCANPIAFVTLWQQSSIKLSNALVSQFPIHQNGAGFSD